MPRLAPAMIASVTTTAALAAIAAVSADPAGDGLVALAQHRLIAAGSLVLAVTSAVALGVAIGRGTSPIDPVTAQAQAEATTRAETEFLANMSHELRTPLNAVIGFAELILSEIHGPLGNRRYFDYVSHIRTGGGRLLEIVDAILDLCQLAAGQHDLRPRHIDPQAIAEECAQSGAAQAEAGKIELAVRHSTALPVAAGSIRLKQVLVNLLSNAIGQSSRCNNAGDHRASSTGALAPDVATRHLPVGKSSDARQLIGQGTRDEFICPTQSHKRGVGQPAPAPDGFRAALATPMEQVRQRRLPTPDDTQIRP